MALLNDSDHLEKLKKEVKKFRDDKDYANKYDFFDQSKNIHDCKYQQRIAEGWSKYYPFRMTQLTFITALFITIIISDPLNFLAGNSLFKMILIIILLIIASYIAKVIVDKKFTRLQSFIENMERKIQYEEYQAKKLTCDNNLSP